MALEKMADSMALGREKFNLGRDWVDDDDNRAELPPGVRPGVSKEERKGLIGVVPGSCDDNDEGWVSCRGKLGRGRMGKAK